jgi:RNA polymerase sigma-70 factor, ECF subfamily
LVHSRQSAFRGVLLSQAEQDDAQLVRASQRGDQGAFALLVRRHQRRIFNLSLGMLKDEDDASECTQEAFVAAWQGLPGFRHEARFSTWLFHIAYQCGLRQLERRKWEHARHSAEQAEQVLAGRRPEKQGAGTTRRQVLQALVREQLEHLPLTYRTVLILRHLHDQTYEEIATILSMPIGTVKTRLFRARALLKECFTAPLVTRETMVGTPLTENEEVMHPSGPFPFQERRMVSQRTCPCISQRGAHAPYLKIRGRCPYE